MISHPAFYGEINYELIFTAIFDIPFATRKFYSPFMTRLSFSQHINISAHTDLPSYLFNV